MLFDRIRRNTDGPVLLLLTWTVFYSFAAAASRSDWPSSMLADPAAFLRMAIPSVAVLTVLVVRNGFADPESRAPTAAAVDAGLALASAILSQELLYLAAPGLMLPRWRATQGFAVAWFFLAALRAGFPPRPRPAPLKRSEELMRIEEVRWLAEESARQSRRWRTGGLLAAGCVALFFGSGLFLTSVGRLRAGFGLIAAGAMVIVWCLGGMRMRAVPDDGGVNDYWSFQEREWEQQYVLLKRVLYWYVGAVVPGIVLLLLGSTFYAFDALMYVFLLAELMRRAAANRAGGRAGLTPRD